MGRLYYVSWVDKRTDPWPQWERVAEAARTGTSFRLDDRPVRLLPADHPLWPGVPLLEGAGPQRVLDKRQGQFDWPGLDFSDQGGTGRLYLGPTLSALFHPKSPYPDLKELTRVWLLYPAGAGDSPHPYLERVCQAVARARAGPRAAQKVRTAAVEGIDDPTEHAAIMRGSRGGSSGRTPSTSGAGTRARPASWST
jgi:hypothetical protein